MANLDKWETGTSEIARSRIGRDDLVYRTQINPDDVFLQMARTPAVRISLEARDNR